jgi:hypothetical protein
MKLDPPKKKKFSKLQQLGHSQKNKKFSKLLQLDET